MSHLASHPRRASAFTLIELLVATSILIVMLGLLMSMTDSASRLWRFGSAKVTAFQNARSAFETMTRSISSATLNTYYDYYGIVPANSYGIAQNLSGTFRTSGSNGNSQAFVPLVYGRRSDLEFVSGKNLINNVQQVTHSIFFQAPLDYTNAGDQSGYLQLGGLLNTIGFYVVFNDDKRPPPALFPNVASRYRFRLMEFLQPTENFSVYLDANILNPNPNTHPWFNQIIPTKTDLTQSANIRLLAENIVACIICPRLSTDPEVSGDFSSLTTDYEYDSVISNLPTSEPPNLTSWNLTGTPFPPQPQNMNQLPPVVHLCLVAVDETSMLHIPAANIANAQVSTVLTAMGGINYTSGDPNELFVSTTNETQFQTDLNTLTTDLTKAHINYRVFETDIAIHGAKWSP